MRNTKQKKNENHRRFSDLIAVKLEISLAKHHVGLSWQEVKIRSASIFGEPSAAQKFADRILFPKIFCGLNIQLKKSRTICIYLAYTNMPLKNLWNNVRKQKMMF